MKKIIIISAFFLYQNFYAQNLEDIMNKDTLYVCFDYGQNQEVQKDVHIHPEMGQRARYYFRFNKKFLVFYKQNYMDYDAIDNNKKADVLKVPKKQKDLKAVYFKLEYKTFYLIDKKEFKNGMIILREVRSHSNFHIEL